MRSELNQIFVGMAAQRMRRVKAVLAKKAEEAGPGITGEVTVEMVDKAGKKHKGTVNLGPQNYGVAPKGACLSRAARRREQFLVAFALYTEKLPRLSRQYRRAGAREIVNG